MRQFMLPVRVSNPFRVEDNSLGRESSRSADSQQQRHTVYIDEGLISLFLSLNIALDIMRDAAD